MCTWILVARTWFSTWTPKSVNSLQTSSRDSATIRIGSDGSLRSDSSTVAERVSSGTVATTSRSSLSSRLKTMCIPLRQWRWLQSNRPGIHQHWLSWHTSGHFQWYLECTTVKHAFLLKDFCLWDQNPSMLWRVLDLCDSDHSRVRLLSSLPERYGSSQSNATFRLSSSVQVNTDIAEASFACRTLTATFPQRAFLQRIPRLFPQIS